MNAIVFFKLALPLLAIGLFVWAAGAGVTRYFRQQPERVVEKTVDKNAALRAGLLCFAACALGVAFFTAVGAVRAGAGASLEDMLRAAASINTTDTDHYMGLAQYGYGNADTEAFPDQYLMIVFFPLFPYLVRALHFITGDFFGYYTLGAFLQPVFAGLGGAILYTLFRRHFGKETAGWALAFAVALPSSFFYALPLTEGLYLVLAAAAFLALDTDKPLAFAVCGCLAALTRSVGLLLLGVAGIWWLQRLRAGEGFRKSLRWLLAAAGPLAGFGIYLMLNYKDYGNPLAFTIYQKEHWNQQLGFFFDTIRYHIDNIVTWMADSEPQNAFYLSVLAIVTILFELAMLVLVRKKLPLAWLGYGLAYVAFADGATWLLSAPRYMLSMLFIPLCMALCLLRRGQKVVCLSVQALLAIGYIGSYLIGKPVF